MQAVEVALDSWLLDDRLFVGVLATDFKLGEK